MGRRNPEATLSKLYSNKRLLAALTTGAVLLAGCSEKGGEEQSPTAASEVTQSPEQVNSPEHSYKSLTDEQKFIDAGLELPSIEQWSDRKQRLFTYYLTQDVSNSGAYQKAFEYIGENSETVLRESYIPPEALLGNENNTDQEILDSLSLRIYIASIVAKEGNGYRDGQIDISGKYDEKSPEIGKKILGGLVAHEELPSGSPDKNRDVLSKSLDSRFSTTGDILLSTIDKMFECQDPDVTARGSNNDPFIDQGEVIDSTEDDTPIVWRGISTRIDHNDGYGPVDTRLLAGLYPVIDDDGKKVGDMWLIVSREATLRK